MVRGLLWEQPHIILAVNIVIFLWNLRQLLTLIQVQRKNEQWAKGIFLYILWSTVYYRTVWKNRSTIFCPENCCWNSVGFLILPLHFLSSSCPPLPQPLRLWARLGRQEAAGMSAGTKRPTPNISQLTPYRKQSRGNLKHSPKDTEFAWFHWHFL